MIIGNGWWLFHVTDRSVELRKQDATYRRLTGRDGYVRVRSEPGMDRQLLIDKAVQMAKESDAKIAELVAADLMPRNVGHYQIRQRELATVFGTPEDPEIIGRKRP
jgi:hypothetical protein